MNNHILKLAIKEAQKSKFKHRHGCVIFKGSHIISVGSKSSTGRKAPSLVSGITRNNLGI